MGNTAVTGRTTNNKQHCDSDRDADQKYDALEMEAESDKDKVMIIKDIPHLQQKYDWDCGISCIKMLLQYFNVNLQNFDEVCKSYHIFTRIWTIHLCIIMTHYEIQYMFYTVMLGVDPSYSEESYYEANYDEDCIQVNQLFQNATDLGISVEKRMVELDELVTHLLKGQLILILIDWNAMTCDLCCVYKCCDSSRLCMESLTLGFQGHYVILCGCDYERRLMYYKNPSITEEICCCSWDIIELARKRHGTDEDVIFIYTKNRDELTS